MCDKAAVRATLLSYQERGVTDNTLKLSPVKKCFIELGLKNYTSTLESSIWLIHADKAKKNCPVDKIIDVVIPNLAEYIAKSGKGKSSETITNDIMEALAKGKPQAKQMKSGATADAAVSRLTDTSKYTGAHKERFDASGKGKGIEGREERSDGSGYVGNYKGAGTYDQTKKK